MAGYDLPTEVTVGGTEYAIRSDYRAVLDVMQVIADPDLTDGERATLALAIFYPESDSMPVRDLQEAIWRMYWFIGGGEEPDGKRRPRVMDWDQDFALIAAPINHVLGYEVRSVPYDYDKNVDGLHWWTFLAAYREIGDCTFAQVVAIRKKRMAGKKLDKREQQFYSDNRDLVDLKRKETEEEAKLFEEWTS